MEENHGVGRFGGSMRVERVQALAARQRGEVPVRYIRPEMEKEEVASLDSCEDIPIIDLGKLINPEFSDEEAAKLHSACVEWGFFQLINHGVSLDTLNELKNDINEFFKLPFEEREKVEQLPGEIEGYGNAFVQSEDQKLDWGDMLYFTLLPPHMRLMELWPTNPPSFRETLCNYSIEVKRVSDLLLNVMSKNLGLEHENMSDMLRDGFQTMRINYYPPCPIPKKVLGLSPHSDLVGLTILLQLSEVPGLQIRRKKGWLPIKSLTGGFIVNIGDVIEIMSNGNYKSIEHRAVVSSKEERLSVATFHSLNFGDIVRPLSELVEGGEARYKSMGFHDYMKMIFSRKLEGKSILDCMKLL